MNILAEFRLAQRRRQAARQLKALPPELLSDIGIEPDRIDEAVSAMAAAHAVKDKAAWTAPVSTNGDWSHPRQRPA